MPIDKRQIESSLLSKGFIREDTHHRYFYHEINGKRTGISTYTSHGSKPKEYDDNLLKMMKKQMKLDSIGQVRDLLLCPMSGNDYNQKLKDKGII